VSTPEHDEELRAARLAAWLEAPAGTEAPDDLGEDALGAAYLLRPDLAPVPRVTLDDILSGVSAGPFAAGREASAVQDPVGGLAANDVAGFHEGGAGAVAPATPPVEAPARARRGWWASPLVGLGLAAAAAAAVIVPGWRDLDRPGGEPAAREQSREDVAAAAPPVAVPAEAEPAAIAEATPVAEGAVDALVEKKAALPPAAAAGGEGGMARGKAEADAAGAAPGRMGGSTSGDGSAGLMPLGAVGGGGGSAAAPKAAPQGYGSRGDGPAAGPWRAGEGATAPVLGDSARQEEASVRVTAQDEARARFNEELAAEKEALDARSEVPREAAAKPTRRASAASRAPAAAAPAAPAPEERAPAVTGPPTDLADCAAALSALPRDGRLDATQSACVRAVMDGTGSVPGVDRRAAWRLALRDAEARGNVEGWHTLARRYLAEVDPSDAEIARKLACPSGPSGCAP
jgi:hypothetical protein